MGCECSASCPFTNDCVASPLPTEALSRCVSPGTTGVAERQSTQGLSRLLSTTSESAVCCSGHDRASPGTVVNGFGTGFDCPEAKVLKMNFHIARLLLYCCLSAVIPAKDATAFQSTGRTSLTLPDVRFEVPDQHYVVVRRGPITMLIVDNAAIDIPKLPNHRAGYNGVAKLTHDEQPQNLFVPGIAGLNFEHIHDGTRAGLKEKFEPRACPMELRIIDEFTVELYQPATANWHLESCGRYQLREDGTIEYSFECIPRRNEYHHNFIGLFWASYINTPDDKSITFRGRLAGSSDGPDWIVATTPRHGVASTHPSENADALPVIDADFPLTLVNHPSTFEYSEPWYYGVNGNMAFLQAFRSTDQIWFAQSPTGGGNGNPAWDFQWFIRDPVVGSAYGFTMRAAYVPFSDRQQMARLARQLRLED
jgi:hypothetical protein